MKPVGWSGDERLRCATTPGCRWFEHLQLWRPSAQDRLTTGDVESVAVLLSGTFDLVGGGTAWPARGARTTPLQGRPMAVFLPPRTEFRAERGSGEIAVVGARRPSVGPVEPGRAALGRAPLLQLAGSGKAFDPNTGEWRPAETFPNAPESLPPRRMQRIAVGPVTIERVLAPDYKAATLCVDEAVLEAGQSLMVGAIPGRARADELLVLVRSTARAAIAHAGTTHPAAGDAVFVLATPGGEADLTIIAPADAPAYVLLAYAGK